MLPALLAAVPAVTKGIQGISQMIKAKKLAKMKRPEYKRPDEISELEKSARIRASQTKLPGQERIESQIDRSASNISEAARKASDPYAFIGSTASAEGQAMDAKTNLGIAASENKAKRQGQLSNALQTSAGYTDKEFELNKLEPYQRAKATESALRGGAIENLAGGASDLAGVYSASLRSKLGKPEDTTGGTTGSQDPSKTTQGVETRIPTGSRNIQTVASELADAQSKGDKVKIQILQQELEDLRKSGR